MPVILHSFFSCLNRQTRTTQAWLATPKLFNQVYTGIYLNKRDITEYILEYSKDACRYLGLFRDHIVPSVLYCYTQVLHQAGLVNSKGKPLVTNTRLEAVWKRLADRLSTVVADTSMITLSTAYTSHFQYKYVYTYIYLYITVYTYDNNVHTTDAALDATILYSLLHSLVQIRVELLGVKPWSTEHINCLLELNVFPPVT